MLKILTNKQNNLYINRLHECPKEKIDTWTIDLAKLLDIVERTQNMRKRHNFFAYKIRTQFPGHNLTAHEKQSNGYGQLTFL